MSDWIGKIAPLIGNALLGPLGGAAAGFLADKLGVKESTVEAVTEALNSNKLTADQIASIKVAEIEFQRFLKQNNIDELALVTKDKQSARDAMAATKSLTPSILTYLITIGFFGILGYMMTDDYKSSEPLLVMLGSLGTAWTACVSFWFGSSHGSQSKDKLLHSSQPAD